jgi:hypothetical protein
MEGWASVMADRYKVSWKAGFDRTEKDLVLLSPGQNSDLDLFFDKVATCNYKKLHMLMCRSEGENKYRSQPTVLGRNITSSPYFQPPSIISVAKSGTAPWPGL